MAARAKAEAGVFSIEKQGIIPSSTKNERAPGRLSTVSNKNTDERTPDEAHPFPVVQSTPTHQHGSFLK